MRKGIQLTAQLHGAFLTAAVMHSGGSSSVIFILSWTVSKVI